MFGKMSVVPIISRGDACHESRESLDRAVERLLALTEYPAIAKWVQFPKSLLQAFHKETHARSIKCGPVTTTRAEMVQEFLASHSQNVTASGYEPAETNQALDSGGDNGDHRGWAEGSTLMKDAKKSTVSSEPPTSKNKSAVAHINSTSSPGRRMATRLRIGSTPKKN